MALRWWVDSDPLSLQLAYWVTQMSFRWGADSEPRLKWLAGVWTFGTFRLSTENLVSVFNFRPLTIVSKFNFAFIDSV